MHTKRILAIIISTTLLLAGTAVVTWAQLAGDDPELSKLQGTWVLASGIKDGKKVNDNHLKQSYLTITADRIELLTPHQHKGPIRSHIIKLDTSKKPHQIQWVRTMGPNAGKVMTAIYEFEGPTVAKFALDPTGKTVPTSFSSKKGSKHIVHVWSLKKK